MTKRLPLVIINGQVQELPSGDSIPGTGGSASYPDFTNNAGKILAVNTAEDDVEWIDPPSSGGGSSIDPTGQKNKVLTSNGSALIFKNVNEFLKLPMGEYPVAQSTHLSDAKWSSVVNSTKPDNFFISGGVGAAYGFTNNDYTEIKNVTPGFGPTDDFDIILKTKVWHQIDTYLCQGVFVGNSSNKKLTGCFYYSGAGFGWQIWNGTTFNSEGYVRNSVNVPATPAGDVIYWRIVKNATNISFYASLDGLSDNVADWDLVGTHLTSVLTEVTQVGVYSNNFSKNSTTSTNAGIMLLGYDEGGVQPVDDFTLMKTHRKILTKDYTLTEDDFYGGQILSAYGDVNVPLGVKFTIPAGLDAKAPATVIQHLADLPVTFMANTGVTLIMGNLTKTAKKNAVVTIIPIAPDTYLLAGGLA